MNIIKLNSDPFFATLASYIVKNKLLEVPEQGNFTSIGYLEQSYLFMHLFILSGNLENQEFFEQMKRVIYRNLEEYSRIDLMRLIDIYKFSNKIKDQQMKKDIYERLLEVE